MFVYQPKFNVLQLKSDKCAESIISWISKEIYDSKPIALHGALIPNLKHF